MIDLPHALCVCNEAALSVHKLENAAADTNVQLGYGARCQVIIASSPLDCTSGMAEGVCSGGTHEPGRKQCSMTASPANRLTCTHPCANKSARSLAVDVNC